MEKNNIIQDLIKLSMLYDFYGELLKENQKKVFVDYVFNDLSLSEIADNVGISRQGVHDVIKRCSKQLVEYEEKLHLISIFNKTKEQIGKIVQITNEMKESKDISRIDEIEEISKCILKEL